jgi:hypothetical protein
MLCVQNKGRRQNTGVCVCVCVGVCVSVCGCGCVGVSVGVCVTVCVRACVTVTVDRNVKKRYLAMSSKKNGVCFQVEVDEKSGN